MPVMLVLNQRQVKSSGLQNSEKIALPPNVAPDATPTPGAIDAAPGSSRSLVSNSESSKPPESTVAMPSDEPDAWPMKIGPSSSGERLRVVAREKPSDAAVTSVEGSSAPAPIVSANGAGSGNSDVSGDAEVLGSNEPGEPGCSVEDAGCAAAPTASAQAANDAHKIDGAMGTSLSSI